MNSKITIIPYIRWGTVYQISIESQHHTFMPRMQALAKSGERDIAFMHVMMTYPHMPAALIFDILDDCVKYSPEHQGYLWDRPLRTMTKYGAATRRDLVNPVNLSRVLTDAITIHGEGEDPRGGIASVLHVVANAVRQNTGVAQYLKPRHVTWIARALERVAAVVAKASRPCPIQIVTEENEPRPLYENRA